MALRETSLGVEKQKELMKLWHELHIWGNLYYLGIRIQKLRGRILNRERINKTIEGIYFICAECAKVCHNVDDGLTEDADNVRNLCAACSTKPTAMIPTRGPASGQVARARRSRPRHVAAKVRA